MVINMKKLLPSSYPPITSYPFISYMLSITNIHNETLPWFIDNFIQLYCNTNAHGGMVRGCFLEDNYDVCPFLSWSKIEKEIIELNFNSFTKFIISCIDSGYYIDVWVDHYYLPPSIVYNKKHFMHCIFIFGYDLGKEEIMVADHFKNGKYSYEKVKFHQVENAYKSCHCDYKSIDFMNVVNLLKYKDYNYNMNINRFVNSINDYLSSKDSTCRFHYKYNVHSMKFIYGLDYYDDLIYCLKTKNIDTRQFFVLCDHKVAMQKKIEYLIKNNFIKKGDDILLKYNNISLKTRTCLNLLIKYKLTYDNNIINKLLSKYSEIQYEDYCLLNNLLSLIEF